MVIIFSFDKVINVNLNKEKVFIDDVKLNNNNKFEIIDFKKVLFIKEESYFFEILNKFWFFSKIVYLIIESSYYSLKNKQIRKLNIREF